jgi:hypothetical protein
MTGRAAGFCAGYPVPGYMNPGLGFGRGRFGYGRGFGRGRGWFGRGRGWRNRYWATGFPGWIQTPYAYPMYANPYAQDIEPKQEMDLLKQEAEELKVQLEDIQNRIETLEKAEKPTDENK